MKQKAAIEKTYAEGLLKLSSVFGSKKIASKVGIGTDAGGAGDTNDSSSHNVFFTGCCVRENVSGLFKILVVKQCDNFSLPIKKKRNVVSHPENE